jgi:hypothetical protein
LDNHTLDITTGNNSSHKSPQQPTLPNGKATNATSHKQLQAITANVKDPHASLICHNQQHTART